MTLLTKVICFSIASLACLSSITQAVPLLDSHIVSLKSRTANWTNPITWDDYSLKIDNERVFFWGAEFHPFRLPSPDLWVDVLEKIKASGFNVVQSYFHWGFHSWNNQTVDLTGIRDMELFLQMAHEVGLYVSARPGPYINAETTAGGFALWSKKLKGTSRTSAPDWTAAWKPYITKMATLFNKYQYPKGPVIAVQIDNEYWTDKTAGKEYMALLEQVYADAGIYVPTFHNAPSNGQSPWSAGLGSTDLLGYDFYPIGWGDCPLNSSDWSQPYKPPYTEIVKYKQGVPLFIPELGGGAFDVWGGVGEDVCRRHTNNLYERLYDRWNLAMGLTMQSIYMTFGGTNWGNLRFPSDYTSYDYGAPIDESRQIGSKLYEKKLLNYFLLVAKELAETHPFVGNVSDKSVRDDIRRNPQTGSEFHILRHEDKTSLADTGFSLLIGNITVPQESGTQIRLNGRDSKILSANLDFLNHHLIYATTDVLTWGTIDQTDFLVLHGLSGEDGEIVLEMPHGSSPKVQFFGSSNNGKASVSDSKLRLNYVVKGLIIIQITNIDNPLTILVADLDNAYQFWRLDTHNGPAFVFGSYLVRGLSSTSGSTLSIRGDTNTTSNIEVFASKQFKTIAWNGNNIKMSPTSYGSSKGKLQGPKSVSVPKLSSWTVGYEAPERLSSFDDDDWTIADHTTTNNPIPQPDGQPVLYADDYDFHVGHIWYRGHFNATGDEKQLNVTVQGGDHSVYSIWFNSQYLGTFNSKTSATPDLIKLPSTALISNGSNVISILVDGMGSDEEGGTDQFKAYRGLYDARLLTSSSKQSTSTITWKLQGNLGGENIVDTCRGTFNVGGKYGERKGWHLPGFPATSKNNFTNGVTLPHNFGPAGIAWYFTDFKLDFPKGTDNPVVVTFDKPDDKQLYRAEFYINGWNFGKVIPNLGPQFEFPVPPGILNTNGNNHLAIAVHGLNDKDNTFAPVQLKVLNSYSFGGSSWKQVKAPSFDEKVYGSSSSLAA
ncbi:beta galactosidase [Halteromyces radiatus]|uniref:beta galactosidase n=1 Tax=Halteromyces radiatus TaxID=101107 RepID=UPI0022205742|nr:beta galactosidase [Halteromyces radiatus]KAI8099290.1 beta galactosidase [Halteromyces radiatus]